MPMYKKAFDTTFFYAAAAIFLAVAAVAVTMQQLWLLLVPVAFAGAFFLVQKPVLLFYVLAATIPWSVEYNFSGSLGTDLPDEPLMLLAAVAAVLILLYRRPAGYKKWLQHPITIVLLLQTLWLIITVATSSHPLISAKFLLAKGWYLLSFFLLPLLLLQNKLAWKRIALVLTLSMLAVTIVSVVRHAGYGFTFADVNKSLSPFFRNHVNYSALLVCTIPLLAAFIFHAAQKGKKTFLILLLLIALVALYLSFARGAWLALIVGIAAYWLLKKRLLLPAYILAMLMAVAAVLWLQHNNRYLRYAHDFNTTVFHTNFKEHLVATYKLKDVSTAERFYRWVAGVRMTDERWQTGYGPNTFYHNYKRHTVPAFKTWVSNNPEKSTVHNYFLLTIIEQGVIGFLLLLFLLGYAFYAAQKLYNQASGFWRIGAACVAVILAMICTVNFLSDLVETDKVGSVFYMCLSFLVVAQAQREMQN
ncbi:MAG: O-antigen ligase family protein [Chitinophagaceae bacterium]